LVLGSDFSDTSCSQIKVNLKTSFLGI